MSTPTLPLTLKPSGQAKLKTAVFAVLGAFIIYANIFLWTNEIAVGNAEGDTGAPMPLPIKLLITALSGIIIFGCARILWVLVPMLFGKRPAAVITERGIESTYIQINLFAFNTLARVNVIPWEALTVVPAPGGKPTVDVFFRINENKIPPECASKLVRKALGSADFFSLFISCHADLNGEQADIVRKLAEK